MGAEETFETTKGRRVTCVAISEMPFADHMPLIPVAFEHFGHESLTLRHCVGVGRLDHVRTDTRVRGVSTCHECTTCGRAKRLYVVVLQFLSLSRETINVGSQERNVR